MKRMSLSYDVDFVMENLLDDIAKRVNVGYTRSTDGSIVFEADLTKKKQALFIAGCSQYGIEVSENLEQDLVQRIKSILTVSIDSKNFRAKKVSALLTDELEYSYTYLSSIFSKATHTSIENFIIITKIEKVKTMLIDHNISLTEVAHQLDYSSVAHLSSQFKKTTGLTVSQFLKLLRTRNNQ